MDVLLTNVAYDIAIGSNIHVFLLNGLSPDLIHKYLYEKWKTWALSDLMRFCTRFIEYIDD